MIWRAIVRRWPLVAAVAFLWLIVAALLDLSRSRTQGHLVYALDDTYISMAMAKNFAQHGVWGITKYEFTSSSSSLLWPLILAVTYRVSGPNEIAPFGWNLLFASVLLCVAYRCLMAHGLPPLYVFLGLIALVVFARLPTLLFVSLEHALHLLLTVAVVDNVARDLSSERQEPSRFPSPLLSGLVALLVMTRYEGLFLTAVVCLLLMARKERSATIALGLIALAPLAIYGAISVARGWYFLPNPLLLKGNLTPTLLSLKGGGVTLTAVSRDLGNLLGLAAIKQLLRSWYVLSPTVIALGVYLIRLRQGRGFWDTCNVRIILFLGATLLHMQFAGTGWPYRYEAYLLGLGVLVVASPLFECVGWIARGSAVRRWRTALVGLLVLASFPTLALLKRAIRSNLTLARASTNIYEQQYQMGLFLKDYYEGETVLAHDIGAINYLADIRCVDVVGLAHKAAARMRLNGQLNVAGAAWLPRSGIAAIYDGWLGEHGGIPAGWIKAGSWSIANNVVARESSVSFYAVDVDGAEDLVASLRRFSARLPAGVRQSGRYVEWM